MKRIYLDSNASMPLRPEAKEAINHYVHYLGNPSSAHHFGVQLNQCLTQAREALAALLNVKPSEVVFTSGATESNFLAIYGMLPRISALFTGTTEHASLLENVKEAITRSHNKDLYLCAVGPLGYVTDKIFDATYRSVQQEITRTPGDDHRYPFLASFMMANHETGILSDLPPLGKVIKSYGGLFHTDASQALGKIPVDFSHVDLVTLSSHKLGGPCGVGALIIKEHVPFSPVLCGGGQEHGLRSGTPSLPLIWGFVEAVRASLSETSVCHFRACQTWRDEAEQNIHALEPNMRIFGQHTPRLPQTLCLSMPHISKDIQLAAFDLEGMAVSGGSACHSGVSEPSVVLSAMGVGEEEANTAIRMSMGWHTQEDDVKHFVWLWKKIYQQLNKKGKPRHVHAA